MKNVMDNPAFAAIVKMKLPEISSTNTPVALVEHTMASNEVPITNPSGRSVKILLGVVVVVGIALAYNYYYNQKQDQNSVRKN